MSQKNALEESAKTRIFEKVAEQSNIDLSKLSDEKIAELRAEFDYQVYPQIERDFALQKEAAAYWGAVNEKIASLSEEQKLELFYKQAAAEGIDTSQFDTMPEDELAKIASHFTENTLPLLAQNNFEPITVDQFNKIAEAEEQQVKLAEAEMLGRHMARAFADETQKIASSSPDLPASTQLPAVDSAARRAVGRARQAGASVLSAAKAHPYRAAGAAGAGVVGLGAAAGLAHHLMKKKKGDEKTASVTLSPDDIETLGKLAAAGDLAGLKEAAATIVKAAEEKEEEEKEKEEKEDAEKKASARDILSYLEMLGAQR